MQFVARRRRRGKKCDVILARNLERDEVIQAGRRFLQAVREVDEDRDARVSLAEFKQAFAKVSH